MNDNKEMKTGEAQEFQAQTAQPEMEVFLRPAVDIYENAQGITLSADLPGVSRDRLSVQVEGNALTIAGQTAIDMPEAMEALYADVNATRYRRTFTLSNELETDNISAEMKDGVLLLKIPKRAELQPRKIHITAS